LFTENQNFDIVRTALDTVFFQEFSYDSEEPGIATAGTGDLFKVVQTDRQAYIGSVNKPVGLFDVIGEVQQVPTETPIVANKYTIPVLDFAKRIIISKDLFDDNMHNVWAENVKDMARKARLSQDNHAFSLFRNAFTTTVTADSVALISASHTTVGGITVSNIVASAPLNSANLNKAIIALREQKDQTGTVIGGVPAILLVPSALFKTAIELTDSALIADSGNNAVNVYRSAYGFKVLSSPFLGAAAGGSDTAWFLLSRNHSVSRLIRQGIETALTPWQYSNDRTYTYQANFREEVFVPDYAGIVGATGV
jgi:phage major head subunit gpT-like protein